MCKMLWILFACVATATVVNGQYDCYGCNHGGSSGGSYGYWRSWEPWQACSHACGGGTRTRIRHYSSGGTDDSETKACNEFCYNGGRYSGNKCHCKPWRTGRCCNDCKQTYPIPHCKSDMARCGGTPDNVRCANCDDQYYSGGYGGGCLECTPIQHCKLRQCSNSRDQTCDNCTDHNVFYKPTHSRTKCERMCSFDENKCWPGICSDELTLSCQCATGFRKSGAKCLLDTQPDILTCRTVIYGGVGKTGDQKDTPSGVKCKDLQDFYGKFQPTLLEFDMTSELTVNITSVAKPQFINESNFGVTDTTVYIQRKPILGLEHTLSVHHQKNDSGNSENVESTVYNTNIEVSLNKPKYHLSDGERLCIHYEAHGGGFVKAVDYRHNTILNAEPYGKTVSTKVLCYRYDDTPPQHCLSIKSCNKTIHEPIQIQSRIIRLPMLHIDLAGWFDPIPVGGSIEHAAGIESYTITVNEVNKGLVSTDKLSETTLNAALTNVTLNLTSPDGNPRLYCLRLEVKDVADNVQQARRFVLYDETTEIKTDSSRSFVVTSASADTGRQWQTHHNDVCMDWKDYFYNPFYQTNSLLDKIDNDENIHGVYEQTTGKLPVNGTSNVYGIIAYDFSWSVNNGSLSRSLEVPDFTNQSFCHSLPLKDGETYVLVINATDIVNNTFMENRTIHIDRSPPHINNIGLEKNGILRLFAHGSTDLAKMNISFEVLDPHSGILNIEWEFGTDIAHGILGSGVLPPSILDQSENCKENSTDCYCPDVGQCEIFKYSVSLNKLVNNNTHIGNHNRRYHFTLKATNKAKLINIEHLDIIVDDSPPAKGVVFEGANGSPDIDYTSEDKITVNWQGFIDHESGIREYRLKLDDTCLNKDELFNEDSTQQKHNYIAVPYTESSVRLTTNLTGKIYTSIIAINNAMEPSDLVCSDGIIRDKSAPKILNLKFLHGRWSESIYCKNGQAWLFHRDLKKIALSATPACTKRCVSNSIASDIFDALPIEISLYNDTDITDFMCLHLPLYDRSNTIFLPNDHIFIQWDISERGSQVDDCLVGFGVDITNTTLVPFLDFKSTHSQTYFKVNHLGVGAGEKFYAQIKTINKAMLEKVIVIGPILIDETSPRVRTKPEVNINEDMVIIGWENDTFYDLEQKDSINQLFFQIAYGGDAVTPLLEWRIHDSLSCFLFSGGCFKYPIRRLQKIDSDLGKLFSVNVYAYNNAGHFTKVTTDMFKLPSRYPPGQATVLDIDPVFLSNVDTRTDINLHFTPYSMCASWQGFKHHENILLEVGVGTTQIGADVVAFEITNNTMFSCINSTDIKPKIRYFFLIRASCTGGITISSSNGVIAYEENYVVEAIDVSSEPPLNPFLTLDQDQTNTSSTRLCVYDRISIGAMYGITIVNVDHNISIQSTGVLFKSQTFNSSSLKVDVRFVALIERPCFEVGMNNISITMLAFKPKDMNSVIRSSSAIYTKLKMAGDTDQNHVFLKIALFEISKTHSNSSDNLVISYEHTSDGLLHHFKKIVKKTNNEFYIAVKTCTNARCIGPFLSTPFEIESDVTSYDIVASKIISSEKGCSDVRFSWKQFDAKSGINIYRWSISKDKSANSVLTPWMTIADTNERIYQVNECITLPIHGHATMFVCVRGYSAAGNVETNCQQAVTETHGDNHENIYDIDINHETWNTIKEIIHSSNVGDKYTLIHDSELDFGTPSSSVAGVMLYATERTVDWYLMSARRLPRFLRCEHDTDCINSTTNTEGYATFDPSLILFNTVHYICCYSNATNVEREFFTEAQQEINACSNGFIIDDSPPSIGIVDAINTNGYIKENTFAVSWNGFSDNINANSLGYSSRIKYYSTAIGTRVGGEDLKNYTIVGLTDTSREHLKNVEDGTPFVVSVKVTDQAELESEAFSDTLVIDTSPPVPGRIIVNDHHNGILYIKMSTCAIRLEDFVDPHSGIEYFNIGVGTSEEQSDVSESRYVDRHIEYTLPDDMMDGHVYFFTAKAFNRAGLSSRPVSVKFTVDRSPPSGGHVIHGQRYNEKNVNFQHDLSALHVYWKEFEDPHSGIINYRIGLGTKEYTDNIRQFIDVGVRSEHIWNGTFQLGQKYYSTVQACNGAGLCHSICSNGVIVDNSPPTAGVVVVGTGGYHMKYLSNGRSIHIKWFGFDDPQSGIDHYEICIGTGSNKCDIQPFTTCLLQSHVVTTALNLKPMTSYYASVRAFNKAGHNVTVTSDEFKIDDTPPVMLHKPSFVLANNSLKKHVQYERSFFRVKWRFEDNESHIDSHVVSLKTHHEGHTPVEHVHVGDVNELTVNLDKDNWLNNGDIYYITVTSCNVAGLCTTETTETLLIDSTPPHQGGFKPPMSWFNYNNSIGEVVSNITLTWYGFYDAESDIDKYHITVSRNYSGQELSNGIVSINASSQLTTIAITEHLEPDDEIILTMWSENYAGLNSSVSKITVYALLTSEKGYIDNINGILEIERHSCYVHFCNGDCTCAVVGKPCLQKSINGACTSLSILEVKKSKLPIIQVFTGLPGNPLTVTASSACITGHWTTIGNEHLIHRYEWSIGLKDQRIGDGIFDLKNEIPWRDVGKLKQTVYCLSKGSSLEHNVDYVVYVKVWYGADSFVVFKSMPVHTDHTAPHHVKGRAVKDSDISCNKDYDIIDWMDSVTACWNGVFAEQQGAITHFSLALGTTINGSDVFPRKDVGQSTSFTLQNLTLSHGTTYYFTVTAYNNVGLYTTVSSDGFVVDMDTPILGVVFNTDQYVDVNFLSSTTTFAMSWHGFTDHHSGLRSYHIAVVEDTHHRNTSVSFVNVNLKTRFIINDLDLKHGHSFIGLVKAVDAAGHESRIVASNPVTIDTTPPSVSDCSNQVLLYSGEHSTNHVSMFLNFTKNTYYSVKGFMKRYDINDLLTLKIDRFKMTLPTSVNYNGSIEFQHYYFSPTSNLADLTISSNNDRRTLNESMLVSVSECKSNNGEDYIEVKQIGLSRLGVKCLLVDVESSISKVHVGVGTTPGGLQVHELSPLSPSGVIDVDLVHRTQIYVTVMAYNNAGLKSVYKSEPILIDKTPPVVKNVETNVKMVNMSSNEVDIDVMWIVDDAESDIKYCLCGLGTVEQLTDLCGYSKSTDTNSCQFRNLQHGERVFVSVKCINTIELSSIPSSKLTIIARHPPQSYDVRLNVISASPMHMHKALGGTDPSSNSVQFVQTNRSPLQIEWSEFIDTAGIDHYEYRLTSQNTTITDWRECYTTAAALSDVDLVNGRMYTVEVRAVNVGDLISDPIQADVVFHSDAPIPSGKPVQFEMNGQDVRMDWSGVFHPTVDLYMKYDVIVGTHAGFSDILELNGVSITDYQFTLPTNTIITRDFSEIFLTITCTYSTGLFTALTSSYKI